MANPAYLSIRDQNNQSVSGDCGIQGREDCCLIHRFNYGVSIPANSSTGMLTGIRKHQDAIFYKNIDPTSPILFDACCHGITFNSMQLDWYKINDAGQETIYFTHQFTDIKIVTVQQLLSNDHQSEIPHQEKIHIRFKRIDLHHLSGNITASDDWNKPL